LLQDKFRYILAVKKLEQSIEKIKFSLNGVIITRTIDNICNDVIVRKSDGRDIIIKDGKIVSVIQDIEFKAIEKPKYKKVFRENNIGVIDIETYVTPSSTSKVYAIGFKTNLSDKPVIHYINKYSLDSAEIIISLVSELIKPKYNYIPAFYCHNMSRYDIVFMLKTIYDYNDSLADKSKQFKL
jgi:hypothetical protein